MIIAKKSLILLDKVIECVFEKSTGTDIIKPSELWWYMFYELFVYNWEDKLWVAWDNRWCYDFDYYLIHKKSGKRITLRDDLFTN